MIRSVRVFSILLIAAACRLDSPAIGPGSVTTVRVFASDSVLAVGDSLAFSAQGLDASEAFVVGSASAWSSDNEAVATVDANGVVAGVSVGSATISATIDGVIGQTVANVATQQIALSDSSLTFSAIFSDVDPDSQTVTVNNAGPGTLSGLSLGAVQYGAGGSGWLSVGIDSSIAPVTITARAALGALLPATYAATVNVFSTVAGNSPVAIDVSFVVIAPPSGPPGHLVVITEPGGATASSAFTTQPVVEIRDAGGARVFGATIPVTASILSGDGVLLGTSTVSPVSGQATFTNLLIRGPQAGGDTVGFGAHRLEFTAAATDPDTSATFNVAVSFGYNVAYLFGLPAASCLNCHSSYGDPAVLVNQLPTLNSTGCGTLVVPSSSATSFLMQKMDNTHTAGCGTVMPTGGVLSVLLRSMVRSWIDEGAANN